MIIPLVLVVLAVLFYFSTRDNKKYQHIPGPPGLPVLGNALDIISNNEKKCTQWAHQV